MIHFIEDFVDYYIVNDIQGGEDYPKIFQEFVDGLIRFTQHLGIKRIGTIINRVQYTTNNRVKRLVEDFLTNYTNYDVGQDWEDTELIFIDLVDEVANLMYEIGASSLTNLIELSKDLNDTIDEEDPLQYKYHETDDDIYLD